MSIAQAEANKAAFRRFQDASGSHDAELISATIDEIVEPNVQMNPPPPVAGTGARAMKELVALLHRAFPDLQVAIEDLIAEGDRVVSRNFVTGTHLGEYMGLPATGKSIAYSEIFIFRFADGRIAETWGVVDVLTQMRQLGMVPA